MTLEHIGTSHVPLTPAVRAGDYVFVSGQVPLDERGATVGEDIKAQTRQVLANIERVLDEARCTMSDVVKTTVWLRRAEDFAAFNEAYAEIFVERPPARSTVASALMLDVLVEIEAVAYRPL